MIKTHLSLVLVDGFFAIHLSKIIIIMKKSHNPYFSRWFSAIRIIALLDIYYRKSQSLF